MIWWWFCVQTRTVSGQDSVRSQAYPLTKFHENISVPLRIITLYIWNLLIVDFSNNKYTNLKASTLYTVFKITNGVLCRELMEYLELLEWTEDQEKLGLRVLQYVNIILFKIPFLYAYSINALTLLVGRQEGYPACKWGMGDGGGGHHLVWMEWRPSGWSMCLSLLIFPCTIKSTSSLLAPAHPGGPGKMAVRRLWWFVVVWWFLSVCYCKQHRQWEMSQYNDCDDDRYFERYRNFCVRNYKFTTSVSFVVL